MITIKLLQIDLARQKESLTFIKEYAQFAKKSGYDGILFYLENAVRTSATPFFDEDSTYSKTELREIIDYVESLGLEAIPAFETLAHLNKFLQYKPLEDFAECKENAYSRGFSGYKNGSCGCVSNMQLREFMDEYVKEVSALFHSKYIHMGLDEPFDFANCPKCKERIDAGITKQQMFLDLVLHSNELVNSLGKRMMMWDDFFEYFDIVKELPRNIIMCNWNYMYISHELPGHWTGRIKKDWLRTYDELGIDYIVCHYADRSSSPYNLESFYQYTKKHKPFGMLTTAWEYSSSFYQGCYPYMAYAVALFDGKVNTREEAIDIYAQFTAGDRNCADILYTINVPAFIGGYNNIVRMAEYDYLVKYMHEKELEYFLPRLEVYKNSLKSDAVIVAYNYILEYYLNLKIQRLGNAYFDTIEHGKNREEIQKSLLAIKGQIQNIKKDYDVLWKKYRLNIKSENNNFENKYASKIALLDRLIVETQDIDKGVLYVDLTLQDGYGTIKALIETVYEDGEKEQIYSGGIKLGGTGFDIGGTYGFRFALQNKKVRSVYFSLCGEGDLGVEHIKYLAHGVKYEPTQVSVIEGIVKDAEYILYPDSRFALLGVGDGLAHVNDLSLSKKQNTIRVDF